ncbi:MAG: IS66 family transposase [Hahellaceae bacterium]|nr:IS66 family transposase [Hahellaceae bacterium]
MLDESLKQTIKRKDADIHERDRYILKLEEIVRLRMLQKFAASSEKLSHQIHLFDEAELEAELAELLDSLPEAQLPPEEAKARKQRQSRTRDFSDTLVRERVELRLTRPRRPVRPAPFSKVKEELEYIPAQLKVLEIWQEKAVFETATGDEVISASRPVHPLGKSFASPSLLAQVITSKYADGLPLYRQEQIFKRLGHEISRTCMANWVIQLSVQLKPLLQRLRESQCSGDYLQADETRMQVLKEKGKTAQSQKWMWVTRGGPPSQLSVLFEYDPSRAQGVADRLLQGFSGVLQADAYAGYASISKQQCVTRIGCWDHARRKFVEVVRANARVDAGAGPEARAVKG